MSETRYARDRTLRLDKAEAGVLAKAVMARIGVLSELQQQRWSGPSDTLAVEVRTLRSLLERLSG